jgi:translation initiation factor IF-3
VPKNSFDLNKRRCVSIASNQPQLNFEIRDAQVRLVAADGSQAGIMSAADALRLAERQNLDLVKIAPMANPPVCKIMDYNKYRFEQAKREKEARKNQHVAELKEIRLSLGIGSGDMQTKAKAAHRFLEEGNKVKTSIRFRGREMAHPQIGNNVMKEFAELLADVSVIEKPAKLEGRQMLMFLAPKVQVK